MTLTITITKNEKGNDDDDGNDDVNDNDNEKRKGMKTSRNFRNYKVWQDAVVFATYIYKLTATLPYFEKKGLCDQLQRAVVSISSNIAEGAAKPSDVEFVKFLYISLGSAYEVETQLLIAKNIGYVSEEQHADLLNRIVEIEKQLSGLINSIKSAPS